MYVRARGRGGESSFKPFIDLKSTLFPHDHKTNFV